VGALAVIGLHIGGRGYGDGRSGWLAGGIAMFNIVVRRFVTFLLFTHRRLLLWRSRPLSLTWGGLAGCTAYRVGSGLQSD
jgi:hypothetical protein